MTGLLLVTLLNLAPGIRLGDNFADRDVVLHGERHTPPFYSEVDELPPHVVEELNAEQLKGVLFILDAKRPRYFVPGLMIACGLVAAFPLALVAYGVFSTASGSANVLSALVTYFLAGILGAVAVAAGIVALVGAALLVARWFQRSSYMEVEDRVRARLQVIELRPPPPETLPAQPQVNFVAPRAMQTIMTF